jgi:hypothetical protein
MIDNLLPLPFTQFHYTLLVMSAFSITLSFIVFIFLVSNCLTIEQPEVSLYWYFNPNGA